MQACQRAPQLNARMVLGVLSGAAALEARPSEAWLQAFMRGCGAVVASMSAKQRTLAYAAAASLNPRLAEAWGFEFATLLPALLRDGDGMVNGSSSSIHGSNSSSSSSSSNGGGSGSGSSCSSSASSARSNDSSQLALVSGPASPVVHPITMPLTMLTGAAGSPV
jgi:hypothetical protein